jgi:hypothetical protein
MYGVGIVVAFLGTVGDVSLASTVFRRAVAGKKKGGSRVGVIYVVVLFANQFEQMSTPQI